MVPAAGSVGSLLLVLLVCALVNPPNPARDPELTEGLAIRVSVNAPNNLSACLLFASIQIQPLKLPSKSGGQRLCTSVTSWSRPSGVFAPWLC